DHFVADNGSMMTVTNTRRGGTFQLRGSTLGADLRILGIGGGEVFMVQGNGRVYTTREIYVSGNAGTSSQVLYGGSNPRWDDLPTQDAYTLVKTTEPALEFRKNGTAISNIAFVGTGGITVNDGFG